jgi:hypothetical protein
VVIKRILHAKHPIWLSTTNQFLPLEEGYIVDKEHDSILLQCLQELSIPLFGDIQNKIIELFQQSLHPYRTLTPASARIWLRKRLELENPKVSVAMYILKYTSDNEKMEQLFQLPVFLCRDGKLHSLKIRSKTPNIERFKSKLYIGTEEEAAIFDRKGDTFLQLSNYNRIVSIRIQNHISQMSTVLNVDQFSLQMFADFAHDILFHQVLRSSSVDAVEMLLCGVDLAWVQKLWNWLDSKPLPNVAEAVNSLWLVPLEEGKLLQKVCIDSFDVG